MQDRAILINGDCLEILKEIDDNSLDSLITDPPAGISFMGKEWDEDKGGRKQWIAWMTEVMQECLRVMKPGAHGLVWAIPRTSHWTATALEDAGFEVRDVVTHIFGSGFPKSMDISKAIDKQAGAEREMVGTSKRSQNRSEGWDRPWMQEQMDKIEGSGMAEFKITAPATDEAKQWQGWGTSLKPASERWILCRKPMKSEELLEKTVTFNAQEWDETISNIEKSWHNILDALSTNGSKSTIKTKSSMITELRTLNYSILGFIQVTITQVEMLPNGLQSSARDVQKSLKDVLGKLQDLLTISAQENVTSLADILNELIKKHQKGEVVSQTAPLSEDYILVRKPISEKTVAANVLKHGTGGINIDATRINTHPSDPNIRTNATIDSGKSSIFGIGNGPDGKGPDTQGRFPANLVLSHNDDCEETCSDSCAVASLDEQSGEKNTVSRFFYQAKASKKDKGADNTHPTVKSSTLMSYLIKLITPPNGAILDPFMGSGSTGVAALKEGFKFIGIEKETEYFEIATKRTAS